MMSVLIDGMILITGLGGFSALLLVTLARRFKEDSSEVVNLVNRVLPQTQCAQCGYPGCRPYAEAIVKGEAINRCPPGGDSTISVLAELLGRKIETLDERCGEHKPPQVAVIREEECIGCTLCITACPVDAIIGATRQMHTVIESECTGCDLCLEPCPVDCIDMQPLPQKNPAPVQIAEAPTPCINCGRCIDVCPRDLQPQQLYWHRNSTDTLDRYRLDDCIECGLCDNACPSDIPLTSIFRHSKTARTIRDQSIKIAARTEQRFILREARMADARNRIIERPSENDRSALLASIKAAAGRDKS